MSRIDEFLKWKNETRKVRPPNYYYVTDLTKPCQRQAYYSIVEDRPFPVETLRIFEAGNIMEDYWAKVLEKDPDIRILGTQVPAYYIDEEINNIVIHGRIDILAQHDDGPIIAHEVKTASSCHWMREPKPEHYEQIQFYLSCLNIENGVLDYLDKNALLRGKTNIDISFPVKQDESVAHNMINRAIKLKAAVDQKLPPPGNPEAWNGKICDYCLFKDICSEFKLKGDKDE